MVLLIRQSSVFCVFLWIGLEKIRDLICFSCLLHIYYKTYYEDHPHNFIAHLNISSDHFIVSYVCACLLLVRKNSVKTFISFCKKITVAGAFHIHFNRNKRVYSLEEEKFDFLSREENAGVVL